MTQPAARTPRAADARAWAWRRHRALRLVGAALLLGMAWIHWDLYELGYSSVPTIGPLFLLNVVLGIAAVLALLAAPVRWLAWVELAGALLSFGTLAALVLSVEVGLLGFRETWDAPLVGETVVVEALGAAVLLTAAALHRRPRSPAGSTPA